MSDIGGQGYGDQHNWQRGDTAQVGSYFLSKQTLYSCKCGESFVHKYDLIPDIFEAIKQAYIPEECKTNEN